MKCKQAQEQLGSYLDGELSDPHQVNLQEHLSTCPACTKALNSLKGLVARLSSSESPTVPARLWTSIEQRLNHPERPAPNIHPPARWFRRRPLTIAAGFLMALGLISTWLSWPGLGINQVQASTVNFDILLNGLPLNPDKAIRRFLVLYDARPMNPNQARHYAPHLNFDLPEVLPGGYRLGPVYGLRFGSAAGVAAKYIRERDRDFLTVIFHPPVHKEDFGTHRDYPCVIGRHHGHKVSVGQWTLVHVTSPTTCHCVLSRLDEKAELPSVLSAVAPNMTNPIDPHPSISGEHPQ